MPELPEVETLARALAGLVEGCVCLKIEFFRYDLREPIPAQLLEQALVGQPLLKVQRRSKYLVFLTPVGAGFFHLGMSGRLLCLPSPTPQQAHTHVVVHLQAEDGQKKYLHFVDPRRFGRIGACLGAKWQEHRFLQNLGKEPLHVEDLGAYLWQVGQASSRSIKTLVMDARLVVGVGNIYACEALFAARVHPQRLASSLSKADYQRLGRAIQATLKAAIIAGGTTFRDFRDTAGKPGSFAQALRVYGKKVEPCSRCAGAIQAQKQAGRTSWFCPRCQR